MQKFSRGQRTSQAIFIEAVQLIILEVGPQTLRPGRLGKHKPSKHRRGKRKGRHFTQPSTGLIQSRDAGVMYDISTGTGHLDRVSAEGSHFPGICSDQVTSVADDRTERRRSFEFFEITLALGAGQLVHF